ncbi:hypothetical protein J4E81_004494 [Alternaria sp. BMP 2799]|uniref:uncharacterized protein n=1 Tax=Alternaria viburni TaxID=566460 RepID=UPI0020C2591A|nr:uncharacterized protein J4E79_008390 [Alternaria viburni]KAI4654516.1 hypothetical protein J4E79_008390 [Alternaria viburni]KAI4699470.1 hypothetical protein J4E81_004494 [Alternaria sp. BMP 2799]KAI4708585.1 hypothetical protein J4E89_006641 [Alternaria sp. Ai002NY15]
MPRDHRQIRPASAALHVRLAETAPILGADRFQRVGLWNPAHGLRFATTATAEAPTPDIPEATETESSPQDDVAAAARTDHPSPHTNNEAGDAVGQDGEASTGHVSENADSSGLSSEGESEAKDDEDVDEHVSLTYQIPEEKLRAAMLATPQTRDSYWSAKLYQGPDGEAISTHYCKSFDVAERVAKYFLQEKVVGFDIEWKPRGNPYSIKQNASLIQLACEDRIALFHVSLFSGKTVEQLMPPSLRAVLESPNIYKVGVAIKGDFKRLEKYLNIQSQGVFELSRLHNLVEWYEVEPSKVSNRLVKLASQVLQHLQLPLYKGERLVDDPDTTSSVRESDWSLSLDLQQIHYAAADAYAGFRLYHMLEWKRTRMKPAPPPVALCDFDNKPTPRPKVPRKRIKAATKSDDAADVVAKPSIDVTEEQQEDEEDAEGYETATEEFTDSHELEDAPNETRKAAPVDDSNKASAADAAVKPDLNSVEESGVSSQKRIGRVSLSWLQNTDPGYPELPKTSQEEDVGPQSTGSSKDEVAMQTEKQGHGIPGGEQNDSDDEYPDPELEDALRRMSLDESGKLIQDGNDAASEHTRPTPTINQDDLGTQSVLPTHLATAQASNTAKVGEPSGLKHDSLDVVDSAVPTPAPQSNIGLLNESSRTPEYNLATTWAQEHLQVTIPSPTSITPSRIRATVTHLRAYHMWHYQKLSVEKMAALLRDPPLSNNTIANYILQAVTLERLEYEEDSLRSVLLALPSGMRKGRWRGLAEEVGV